VGILKVIKYFCFLLGGGLFLFTVGCASGHCRGRKTTGVVSEARVKVFKSDGSRQCAKNSGVKVSDMAKTLQGIPIFSMERSDDGKMRIQACGTSTGQINVYEISEADLEKAKALGFALLPTSDNK
jgi:hypothetical protein